MRRALRSLFALALVGCTSALIPLDGPIPAQYWVSKGAWIVLTNHDLQQLPEAARQSAGKQFSVSLPPVKLSSGELAAATLKVMVAEGKSSITAEQDLKLSFPIESPSSPLAWERPNRAACGLQWQWAGASLEMTFRLSRDAAGVVDVTLANSPSLQTSQPALKDHKGCLDDLPLGSLSTLEEQVLEVITNALTASYVEAARTTLLTVLPVSYEFSGGLTSSVGKSTLAVGSRFSGLTDELPSLLRHNGSYAATALDVGMNSECHTCAEDAPPPKVSPQPLPAQPPPMPATGAVLRRALVFDRALLAHMAWTFTRSGRLCARVSDGIENYLPANWAKNAAPSLGLLVSPGSVGASFWPGTPPTVRIVTMEDGAGVEWTLEDALLEINAPVGGVELGVLRVEGSFRLTLAPKVGAGAALFLEQVNVDSAVLSSPLVPGADLSAGTGLVAVVRAALRGIFAAGFGLSGASSTGVVVGSARLSDHLWIWLAGGGQGQP